MKYTFKKEAIKSVLNMGNAKDRIGEKVLSANTLRELIKLVNNGAEGNNLYAVITKDIESNEFEEFPFIIMEDDTNILIRQQFIIFVKDIQEESDIKNTKQEVKRLVRNIANKISIEEAIFLQSLLCALGEHLEDKDIKKPICHNLISIIDIIEKAIQRKPL